MPHEKVSALACSRPIALRPAMAGCSQRTGYVQRDGYPADAYSLIDLDAYLSGSTDYTPVQMWQDE